MKLFCHHCFSHKSKPKKAPTDPGNSVTLKKSLHPERFILWGGLLLSCVSVMANFGLLFLSGWFLAATAAAGLGGIAAQNLFNIFMPSVGVRFFATLRIISRYLERIVTHDAALRVTGQVRSACFAALIPRSAQLATTGRGDILSRFVKDTEILGQYPLDVSLPRRTALLCSALTLGIIACFSWKNAAILALGLSVGGGTLPLLLYRMTRMNEEEAARHTKNLHNIILENLQAMADILFCGAAERRLELVNSQQRALNNARFYTLLKAHITGQFLTLISAITLLPVLAVSSLCFRQGEISGPDIAMFSLGSLAAFDIVSPLLATALSARKAKQAEERLSTLCTLPHNHAEIPGEGDHSPSHTLRDYSLCLDSVSLSFEGKPVLRHLSLNLEPGQRVALTGSSGAGKTTLIRLIMRFLEPDKGRITLGGQALCNFTTATLSRHIGVLLQDPHLFDGSLRRNFLIASGDATEEKMWEVLRVVGLAEDIISMPDKLDTLCGENGIRLSGGQKRRFAVAQILLRRPDILVLDEPTESLPPEKGRALMANIVSFLPQATILCITHRPEPLLFMEKGFSLKNGTLEPIKP